MSGNDEQDHAARLYSNKSLYDDHNPCDRIRPGAGNRHSYFLRAKTPRFVASDNEDAEFKKPSSSFSHGSRSHDEFQAPLEEEDLANCLVMLSNKSCRNHRKDESVGKDVLLEKGMFQCKACKKVFSSHQALGGHRASHKKVKGCFASKLDGPNDDDDSTQEDSEAIEPQESDATRTTTTRKRAKMHECSVCRRVFSSGQALGGHKRCHWLTTSSDNAFISSFHDFQYDHHSQQLCNKTILTNTNTNTLEDHKGDHQLDLNLNLPPSQHDQNHRDYKDVDDETKSRYQASTRLCLQQKMEKNGEEGSVIKLSDLREMSKDGGWLQMGIASTTEMS